MLLRSKADPTIIACVARHGTVGMKIKSAAKYYPGEQGPGTLFKYSPKYWNIVHDAEAQATYARFRATTHLATIPPGLE